jgi:hypothetical protein
MRLLAFRSLIFPGFPWWWRRQATWPGLLAPRRRKEIVMLQSETLRKAIENLIDAKLVDAMARPDGLNRLLAHRRTGVAAPDIRNAERRLEETLAEMLSFSELHAEQAA